MISWLAQFKRFNLTSHEANILVYACQNNHRITNEEGREITGLETLKVSRLLINLRRKGILIPHSAGPNTYYTLNQKYLSPDVGFNSDMNTRENKSFDLYDKMSGDLYDKTLDLYDKNTDLGDKMSGDLYDKILDLYDKNTDLSDKSRDKSNAAENNTLDSVYQKR